MKIKGQTTASRRKSNGCKVGNTKVASTNVRASKSSVRASGHPPVNQPAATPKHISEPIPHEEGEGHDHGCEDSEEDGDPVVNDRRYSEVWDHFVPYDKVDKVLINNVLTEVTTSRAKCKHCPKGLGDILSGNGTSAMRTHVYKRCKWYKKRTADQMQLAGDKTPKNKMVVTAFDQSKVMKACIEMVVIDEMPFSTVDKAGFRRFCSVSVPQFVIPSRRLFVKDFFKMYEVEKCALRKELSTHRVSLTTDTWTSVQNLNYMVLTAHFIDNGWKMHKRILNFCQIPNHQGATIGRLLETCLLDWKIDKVLSITVDNASANKVALDWLRGKMNRWENSKALLKGSLLHVRCTAHIVNLIVRDGLKRLNRSVLAIRNAVAYVRSSPQRLTAFKSAVSLEKLETKGLVVLDVTTRWNSTFEMLESALKFTKAFERLKEDDNAFLEYFDEHEGEDDDDSDVDDDGIIAPRRRRKRVGPPIDSDWEKSEVFVEFLRVFYDITLRVSSSLKPAVHTTLHDIINIERRLKSLFIAPEILTGSETDKTLTAMAVKMNAKYQKYFGRYTDMNRLIYVGLILDPRFKLGHIQHILSVEGFGHDEVLQRISDLKGLMMQLYECYIPPQTTQHTNIGASHSSTSSSCMGSGVTSCSTQVPDSRADIISDWKNVVKSTQNSLRKHELDKYLDDNVEEVEVQFDILLWWKLHGDKYPVLAKIAKDVLATQVSTVASESAFSTGGRVIDYSRSSMTPKTVEALISLQNWLKGDMIVPIAKDEPSLECQEFYETCESDARSSAISCASISTEDKGKEKVVVIDV